MEKREPGWELYRTFLEVVRDGSLSGAARKLELTQPTVGRHIDALESVLGLPLFTRSQRGLTATAAALELVPHAETMATASAALRRAASGETTTDRGTVRVTASEIIGCEVLPAILAGFRHQYPEIAIELALSNRNEDLLRRDADIAVRMVRPTQKALIARRIGKSRVGLYTHRDYVRKFGTPKSMAELSKHSVIGFDRDDRALRALGPMAQKILRETVGLRCDSIPAQLAALRAGIGIGGCQRNIAERTPELVPVLAKAFQFELEVWIAMHENLKSTRRIRLLFDWMANGLAAYLRSGQQA
jgi:DNA-binding transcriptional LysR family regulator